MTSAPLASVVIPAHDEGVTIDRCLSVLLADAYPGEFEVVVAANGCTDDTVERARRHMAVTVLDLPSIGKARALNAGDGVASALPRIYLDADVELSTRAARSVVEVLRTGRADIAAPRPRPLTARCSWLVRAYYAIWSELPVITEGYVGSGVYAVSAPGHAHLTPFPDVVADDQYARRRFAADRRVQTDESFDFHPARTARALVHRSVRVQAGNRQLLATVGDLAPETSSRGVRGVLDVVRSHPRRVPQAVVFLAIGGVIRVGVRREQQRGGDITWNRDSSSR